MLMLWCDPQTLRVALLHCEWHALPRVVLALPPLRSRAPAVPRKLHRARLLMAPAFEPRHARE
jgi:hypothetical protein